MRIGWFLLILLCCSTCKKGDYREKYVGTYKSTMISEFRFVGSPAVTNSYYNAGNVEISLSDDVQGQVLVKFDNSLNFQYLDSIYRYDEIMNDNQLLLQINENGDMNARIYNNMNLYININFKIDGNELTMVYFNELLRTRPIMHILTGKKII